MALYLVVVIFIGLTTAQQSNQTSENSSGNASTTETKLANIQEEFNTFKQELKEFNTFKQEFKEFNTFKHEVKELQLHMATLREENTKMKQAMHLMKANTQQNVNFIGFFAYHSSEATYPPGSTIIFPTVITNLGPEGSMYDPVTATFHCGVSGVYFFSFSLLGNGDGQIYAALEVGGTQYAWGHAPSGGPSYATSNSVVIHCVDEDVKVISFSTSSFSHVHCCQYSTFSGYLLYMD